MEIENLNEMHSEEELLNYIKGNEGGEAKPNENVIPPVENKTGENTEKPEDKVIGDDIPNMTEAGLEGKIKEQPEGANPDEPEEQEMEFSNIVEYLNEKHDLGLNIDNLPEDLSREQEAEIVADLLDKIATSADSKLKEYKEIEELLSDEEIKAFIEAKRQGATLKDFVEAISTTPDAMKDEDIISLQLRSEYPNMSEDEIKDLVDNYKTKGVLEKMANVARDRMKQYEQQKTALELQAEEAQYKKDVQELAEMLGNTTAVYGVPLTKEMKEDVFNAAVKRDESGLTYLDKALQSNEGVILATLGLLHMQDLMRARASTDTNKRNKKLVEKLFENPADLQSGEQDLNNRPQFDPNVANSF